MDPQNTSTSSSPKKRQVGITPNDSLDTAQKQSSSKKQKKSSCQQQQQDETLQQQQQQTTTPIATRGAHACFLLTPLDDCLNYLKRNPVMREIIGQLIRQEEEEKAKVHASNNHQPKESSPVVVAESNDATIQQWLNQFGDPSNALFSKDQDYDSLDAADYYKAFSSKDDSHDEPPLDSTIIPEPLTELTSPTAALRKLSVHFMITEGDSPRPVGFTMKYSDGVEMQSMCNGLADLRGTETVHLQLEPNEHIIICVRVRTQGVHGWFRFLTTNERWLEAFIEKRPDFVISDWIQQIASARETGKVVQRFEFLPVYSLIQTRTVPMADIDKVVEKKSPEPSFIPTLKTLAYEAATSSFQNAALKIERDRKVRQQSLKEKSTAQKCQSNRNYQQQLVSTPEAALYRALMSSLVPRAKAKLDTRAKALLDSAKKESLEITRQADMEKGKARLECAKEHLAVFREHQRFLDASSDLSHVPTSERETLCFSPECRNLFHYNKVPKYKRCTVPGCTAKFPNCGCSIMECGACHEIVCKLHLRSHQCTQKPNQQE